MPVAARGWFTDALAELNPDRKVELIVDGTTTLQERTGPMFSVARGAATVDADVAQLWEAGKQGHHADLARLAASLQDAHMDPSDQSTEWATTALYVLLGLETWHLVRHELNQDQTAYSRWLLATLHHTFTTTPTPDRTVLPCELSPPTADSAHGHFRSRAPGRRWQVEATEREIAEIRRPEQRPHRTGTMP